MGREARPASFFPERGGFEPPVLFRAHTPSKRAPSTTRTPLQNKNSTGSRRFESPLLLGAGGIRSPVANLLFAPSDPLPSPAGTLHGAFPSPSGSRSRGIRKAGTPVRIPPACRSRGDSNPRSPCELNGFRNHLLRPLGHRSSLTRTIPLFFKPWQ